MRVLGQVILCATAVCVAAAAPVVLILAAILPRKLRALARLAFSPLAGSVRLDHEEAQNNAIDELRKTHVARPVTIASEHSINGRVHGVFVQASCEKKVVILIGGNSETWEDMLEFVQFHLSVNNSVLCITYSGYPDPNESYRGWCWNYIPCSASITADVNAALTWVVEQGTDKRNVVVEGHSLGTLGAHILGSEHQLGAVVAVQPLASIEAVGVFAALNFLARKIPAPQTQCVRVLRTPLRVASKAFAFFCYGHESFRMDQCVTEITSPYCAFAADRDDLMCVVDDERAIGQENFARALLALSNSNHKKCVRQRNAAHGKAYTSSIPEQREYVAFLDSLD